VTTVSLTVPVLHENGAGRFVLVLARRAGPPRLTRTPPDGT
jgi:hypothetical protein